MTKDFRNIAYLNDGNDRQQLAYKEIVELDIFEKFKKYNPILTGTIPIDIDLPDSDLDIICECDDHREFSEFLIQQFGDKTGFKIDTTNLNGIKSTVAEFKTVNFTFEFFGQNIPTNKQNAYRHMLIEYLVLAQNGEEFKRKIKKLKSEGIKTEPAFAKLLKLDGNPYLELLKWK